MTPAQFRAALAALRLSRAEAARLLRIGGGATRVSEYATGYRKVPPYIAAHMNTLLELAEARRLLRALKGT